MVDSASMKSGGNFRFPSMYQLLYKLEKANYGKDVFMAQHHVSTFPLRVAIALDSGGSGNVN